MEMGDVVRLVRDIADETGQVIPSGTRGTIQQEVATGLVVKFCLCEPSAVVSALVVAQDLEFQWCDRDNPLIPPGTKLKPWLPHFHSRIAARKSKSEP